MLDSLHIGSLVPIILLAHLQKSGHQPIALVGGATGMIGDPSGKSSERNLLDEDTLRNNEKGIKKQLSKFLSFDEKLTNHALIKNNYDWMKDFSFLDFIRDIGKHITVNYMKSKDSVKNRIDSESGSGMSFTEFTYQLVQGFDLQLGSKFIIEDVELEVVSAAAPCKTIADSFIDGNFNRLSHKKYYGDTRWYCRVLKTGTISMSN